MNYVGVLKEIRGLLNLSQEDLARKLGVSFASINRWETGKHNPSKMAIKAIQQFCEDNDLNELTKEVNALENK